MTSAQPISRTQRSQFESIFRTTLTNSRYHRYMITTAPPKPIERSTLGDTTRKIFKVPNFILALLLFLAIEFWFAFSHPFAKIETINLDRSEAYCASASYLKTNKPPYTVILGSSLVAAAVLQAEADFRQAPFARMLDRQSKFIENWFLKNKNVQANVYCLATGGEMVSDAYFIAKHNFKGPHTPKTVIYGVAPRDFQDNLLPSIDSSMAFKSLAQLEDLGPFLNRPGQSLEEKGDLILSRISSLWRYRNDSKTYFCLRSKKLIEKVLPFVVFDKYGETLELKPRKKGFFPEEAKGTLMSYPGIPLEHLSFEKTQQEYIRRYNPAKPKLIDSEFGYLEKLIALCQTKHIQLILVNMPLSQSNKDLMPKDLYINYNQRLHKVVTDNKLELIDLNDKQWSIESNYVDGVHLTPQASQSFLSCILERVSTENSNSN